MKTSDLLETISPTLAAPCEKDFAGAAVDVQQFIDSRVAMVKQAAASFRRDNARFFQLMPDATAQALIESAIFIGLSMGLRENGMDWNKVLAQKAIKGDA